MNAQPKSLLRSLLASCFLLCSSLALAEAPQQKTQVPGYYRMQLGQIEVTALYDGAIKLDTKLLRTPMKRKCSSCSPACSSRARPCRPLSMPT